jgi:hypothetical protein
MGAMDTFVAGAILGLFAGIVVAVGFVIYALIRKPLKCPDCGASLPMFRKPANKRQGLWGGWTCPECGCEVDRRGRKVTG